MDSLHKPKLTKEEQALFDEAIEFGLSEQDALDMIATRCDIDVNPLAVLDDTVDSNGSTD